ncbi:MAG: type II toxin-antitoxin system VapC family toxin [Hyphomonadaceae bacterium]
MVIDTSALIEIYIDGPLAGRLKAALKPARGRRFMSAASLLEAHIVVRRRFAGASMRSRELLDLMMRQYAIAVEAVQESHAALAVEAYYQFGKGAGAGALNFGDCFAYALAKSRDDELLFVGDDFARTDLKVAQY